MKYTLITVLLLLNITVPATAREPHGVMTVVQTQGKVFLHFETSGRAAMAVAKGHVGIVWEDNRSGTPQVYAAFKEPTATHFSPPLQISTDGPAYEPAITAIDGSFVIAWEAHDHLWLRLVHNARAGAVIALSPSAGRQVTLTTAAPGQAIAAWSAKDSTSYHIRIARLRLNNSTLSIEDNHAVDTSTDRREQLYPSVATSSLGIAVAWEDRRQGATRIFTAFAPTGKAFEPYQLLNDFRQSRIRKYGNGTGAMRVVLGSDQHSQVMATWLDKRDFEQGYDVYAAYSDNGGHSFGSDEKVQDPLGDNTPQWHPTLAMSAAGKIVAAWDDTRDGTPDVWFSTRTNAQWSSDDVWPGGSGEGAQTLPALYFAGETLHAAWLERHSNYSAIRYSQP